MTNRFDNGAAAIQFNTPPDRGNGDTLRKRQRRGFDSNGERYVANKHPQRDETRTLVFPRVPTALLADLHAFRLATLGTFTWYDHSGAARVISFAGEIRSTQINPSAHRVEIPLEGAL